MVGDNGWWEWEIKPSLNDRGYPLDYITDGSLKYLGQLRLDFYKHGVERVVREDPYAGLIVLMHGIGLFNKAFGLLAYMPDHTARPDVQAYIRDQDALRQRLSIFRQQLNDCEGYRIPEQTIEARLPQIPLRALH